jgi:hypothetical protein
MADMTQAKVGDRLAAFNSRGDLVGITRVDRLTRTQIDTTGGGKYRRNNGDMVGGDRTWGCSSVEPLTPKLEASLQARQVRGRLGDRLERLGRNACNMTDAQVVSYTAALDRVEME